MADTEADSEALNEVRDSTALARQVPRPRTTPGPPTPLADQWLRQVLTAMGCRRSGRKWQCPAHAHTEPHSASLAIGRRDDGRGAWLHCHAGCTLTEILRALALQFSHLQDPPGLAPARFVAVRGLRREWPPLKPTGGPGGTPGDGFRHEAWHPYGPDHAKERLRRADGAKTLRWESRNPRGEWVPGLLGAREADLPLYRHDEILMAVAAGEVIVLCESESSCDALRGVYATTWAGGAASPPTTTLAAVLADADVVIVPDHDDAGLACLDRLLEALPAARVLLGEPGEDARDLYQRIGAAAFTRRLETATRPPTRPTRRHPG